MWLAHTCCMQSVASFSSRKIQTLQGILPWRKHRFLIGIGRELAHISRRMSFLDDATAHEAVIKIDLNVASSPGNCLFPMCFRVFDLFSSCPHQMACNFRRNTYSPTRRCAIRICTAADNLVSTTTSGKSVFHSIWFYFDFRNTSRHFIKMQ